MRIPTASHLSWFAAVIICGCSHTTTEPIQIGHVAPGENDRIGQRSRHGVLLAVEETNKSDNLIHGRKVVVRHADSRGSPEVAQADAVRLITLNRVVALLGGTDAAQAAEIGQGARPYGVPIVTSTNIAESGAGETTFSLGITAAYQGRALARFVLDGLQPKPERVLVIFNESAARNRELADAFRQELKGIDADPLGFKDDSTTAELQKEIQGSRAVLLVGATPEFARKLRPRGSGSSEVRWLYGGEDHQISAMQLDSTASRDMFFATVYTAQPDSERGKEFVSRYHDQFKEEADVHAALAYEGALWLFDAMRSTSAVTPTKVRDELEQTEQFEGLTGAITLSKGHVVGRPVFIVQMQGSELKLVKTDREGK